MTWPKHYSLKKEHDKSFEIHDKRDKKSFHVAKKGLHPANQIKVMKMQKFSGESGDPEDSVVKEDGGNTFLGFKTGRMDDQEKNGVASFNDYLLSESPESVADNAARAEQQAKDSQIANGYYNEAPSTGGASGSWEPDPTLSAGPAINAAQTMGVQAEGPMAPQAPATQQQAPMPQSPGQSIGQMEQQYTGAVNAATKGQIEQNKQMAALYQDQTERQEATMFKAQEALAGYQKQYDELAADVAANKVDPDRYWNSKTEGQKTRTILGLLLSGLGGNKGGGAIGMLQKNIERDIEAQKMDLGKKENLLAANLRAQGSILQAEQATRLQMAAITQGQAQRIAAQTSDPMVKLRSQQMLLGFQQWAMPLKAQLAAADAQRSMALQAAKSGDPAKLVPHLVPKEHQKQAFSEIQSAQNTKHMSKNILESFEQAVDENTVMKTGAGFLRTPGSVKALHQHMQPTFQDLEGTVRQAAMDNTFKNVTPMPGDSEHTISQKRKALQQYLQSKLSAPTAKAYGIDLSQFPSTAPDAGGDVQKKGGVKYQRREN